MHKAVDYKENLADLIGPLDEFGPSPFWDQPDFGDDPFWGAPTKKLPLNQKALIISGPSRNGNHLIHSILDGHPDISNQPGEDSFLAAFFHEIYQNKEAALDKLRGPDNIEYILKLTGWNTNKWEKLWELSKNSHKRKTAVWAGTQGDDRPLITDYQDTIIDIDYPSYFNTLQNMAEEIRQAPSFMDILFFYFQALRQLSRDDKIKKYNFLLFGSGMRAEMNFIFSNCHDDSIKCVAPLRPFETFYYSFAYGRYKTDVYNPEILQLSWEHWWHKTIDYLILKKRYPQNICLVNFNHVIDKTEPTSRKVCEFLGIDFSDTCLYSTTLGKMNKGNSSFPKGEEVRGQFYKSGIEKKLDPKYWPKQYELIWERVQKVAI